MKELRWIMMVLLASFLVQGAMSMELKAQEGSKNSDNKNAMLLTSKDVNSMGQANGHILLSDLLSTLEQHFDVTFLYKDEAVMNKYVNPNKIRIGEETGQELSFILDQLGIAFQQIDKQTYVLLRKKSSLQTTPVQEEISGTVTDAQSGETLPGVNILVKGTTTGTSTDQEGNFKLEVSSLQDTLVVSFVGYQQQEIPIDGQTTIDVQLIPEAIIGEEMVVTALGIERKEGSLSYSTSEVESEEIGNIPETNIANSLNGKIAGVDVTTPATGDGGSSRIIIRGEGSLAGNNQPLYVVNGMPIDNTARGGVTDSNTGGLNIDLGDGIGDINPDDIESINVLKGGAAAALYGSRASNGAVLITTKKGQAQQGVGVQINSSLTFNRVLMRPDWQYEYGQGYSEGRPQNQSEAISSGRLSFGDPIDGIPSVQFDGVERPYVAQKNNVDHFFQTGTNFKNGFALSGGSESINYRFSANNTSTTSILPNTNFEENNFSLNTNGTIGDRINFGASVIYTLNEGKNRPTVGYAERNPFWGVYLAANTVDVRSMAPGYDENGREIAWNSVPAATNPYFVTNKYYNEDEKNRFIGQLNLTIDLLDNLFIQGRLSRDYSSFNSEAIEPDGNLFRPLGSYSAVEGIIVENNFRVTLNYETSFLEDDLDFTGFVGLSRRRSSYDQTNISGSEFNIPGFYSYTNLSNLETIPSTINSGTNSVLGSLEFGYRELVYLTFTGRQDWFSTLNPDHNGIFYPSIGGSIILSNVVDLPNVFDYLKLRGSWSQVGGSSVDPYAINQSYSLLQGGHNGRPVANIASDVLPNPNLKPLTSTNYEVGIDADFLDSRLGFDITYYDGTTTDDIVQSNIALSSGYTSALLNVGKLSNKGIEVSLDGTPIRREFNWNIDYNISYNYSEVKRLADGVDRLSIGSGVGGATIQHVVGKPYGAIWGYEKKRNEDGEIIYNSDTGYAVRSEAKQLGRGVAPLKMGISQTFSYKNISLDVQIDGKFGSQIYSNFYQYAYRFGKTKTTLPGREDGLTVTGVDQEGNPYSKTWAVENLDTYYDNDKNYTSLFVFDNSFVKLRQMALTYNMPVDSFGFIKSATASLIGRNLAILWKKDKDQNYFDPESSYNVGNAQGLNAFSLPGTRTFGINVTLNL